MPTPDGSISRLDQRQIAYNYRGLPIPVSLGGVLNINRSTLGDGLVGHWPLSQANYQGGVFVDESGNGNDGTPANAPNFAIDSFRNPTGATVFNGSSDYVNAVVSSNLNFVDEITVSAWVKTGDSVGIRAIVSRAWLQNWFFAINPRIRFSYISSSAGTLIDWGDTYLQNNIWYHVVVVYKDSEKSVDFYLNGQSDGSGVYPDTMRQTDWSPNLLIGGYGSGISQNRNFNGSIADVRIYNRALSLAEIQLLYVPSLTTIIELYRDVAGSLTPTGDLARALTLYRSFGGNLTPTGDLASIVTFVLAMGGDLTMSGAISGVNPAWLLLDDALTWQGEWDTATSYNIEDVVLYQTAADNEWHVFVSKTGHNVGNIPTSTSASWRRLYQEKWL